MSDKKEGIELIIDRAEALRVRLASGHEHHTTPPTTGGDERLATLFAHCEQLARELLTEATAMKLRAEYQPLQTVYDALDHVGALMALPKDTPALEIAKAVTIATKRLQELEIRVANFTEASTPIMGTPPPPMAVVMREARSRSAANRTREAYLRAGVAAGILDADDVLFKYAPYDRRAPLITNERKHDSDEPRASWVMDRMEALVLGGWLEDATKNIERVSEYMTENEARMSEDLFDELRRIASKLASWAESVRKGDMFPRDVP